MDKQLSEPAGDAPGGELEVSKITTLKRAFPQTPRSPGAAPLSDAQVLRVLENRRVGPRSSDKAIADDVAVLPPEDTSTRLVLREAVACNAPVSFAVQLQWSVQPVDVKNLPQHPIFHAYTLYSAEGRRAGRTWFFIRLGFFSDAVSAKQVAHYLRPDFASAAVVPVSPEERHQASQMGCSDVGAVARLPARARHT
jgi:hypothetical protein